jgi:RHS repeat-associated protein
MPSTITDTVTGALSSMSYDADGQRVKKTTPRDTTYYFGRYLEQDNYGLTKYYWAGDQMIARRGPDGAVSYLHHDHLDSTRLVTDEQANVNARYNYQPYGAQNPDHLTEGTRHLWHGQRSDDDSGLTYMNARYYDPELAQFISADTIIPNRYRPQTLNRYAFADNDPLNNTDPTGHMSMRVELKKEQEAQGRYYRAMYNRSFGCGAFVTCTRYTPGQLFEQKSRTHRITYSSGATADITLESTRFVGAPDEYGLSLQAKDTKVSDIDIRVPVDAVSVQTRTLADRSEAAAIYADSGDPVHRGPSATGAKASFGVGLSMDAMAVVGVEFGVYLVVDTEGSVDLMVVPGYRVGIDVGVSAAVGGFIYAGADVSQISGRGVNIGVDLPVASGSWQMSCQNASCTDVKHGVGVSYGVLSCSVPHSRWVRRIGTGCSITSSTINETRRPRPGLPDPSTAVSGRLRSHSFNPAAVPRRQSST